MTDLARGRGLAAVPCPAARANRPRPLAFNKERRVTLKALPPCGGGFGWGVAASECSPPHPNPPPQGGREQSAVSHRRAACATGVGDCAVDSNMSFLTCAAGTPWS